MRFTVFRISIGIALLVSLTGAASSAFAAPATVYVTGGYTNNGFVRSIQSVPVGGGIGLSYAAPSALNITDNYVYSHYAAGTSETFNVPISYRILLESGSNQFASAPTSPYVTIDVFGSLTGALGTSAAGTPYNTLQLALNDVRLTASSSAGATLDFGSDPANGQDAFLIHAPLNANNYNLYVDLDSAFPGHITGYLTSQPAQTTPAPSSLLVFTGAIPAALLLRRRK